MVGTGVILEVTRAYWNELAPEAKAAFRFHNISTDEVYGDLHGTTTSSPRPPPYSPSSPYLGQQGGSDPWCAPGPDLRLRFW